MTKLSLKTKLMEITENSTIREFDKVLVKTINIYTHRFICICFQKKKKKKKIYMYMFALKNTLVKNNMLSRNKWTNIIWRLLI